MAAPSATILVQRSCLARSHRSRRRAAGRQRRHIRRNGVSWVPPLGVGCWLSRFCNIQSNASGVVKLIVWRPTKCWSGRSSAAERKDAVHGANGTGGRRLDRNGEAIGLSINFGPLAHWVGFNLRIAQEAAFQAFSHLSQEIGESPGRFATLTLIARNPGISQTELSLANGRDKSSLTPVVEDLVRRGLVAREWVDSDRRTYRLNMTPAGKKTLSLMMRAARKHERNLDRIIGARDKKRFLDTLKRIAKGIEYAVAC